MVLSIEVPDAYPVTLLCATVLPFITSMIMGGLVMAARKTYDVQYPNLYAVPGVHPKADEFNRVQRGHQNIFETLTSLIAMVLVGGLKFPLVAASASVAFCIGSYGYIKGYSDLSKAVKGARYQHPLAPLKPLGWLLSLGTCVGACIMMMMYDVVSPESVAKVVSTFEEVVSSTAEAASVAGGMNAD